MQYRTIGNSDLNVSVVGLGTNNFGERLADLDASARVVHAGMDLGVNLIDTAIGYGGGKSEEHVGNATKDRRDKVMIATKFRAEVPAGPQVVYSAQMARELVTVIPGAITFMPASEVASTSRVLRIEGKLPGEAGYPLQ